MQFTNPPRPLASSLYEEALDVYVDRVAPRARAIYRVGSFRHPGLSDIDLLVIPTRARFDNDAWFAVRHQLPRALQLPFRSNPGIVSADAVDVLRFTTHRKRCLLFGTDLAAGITCLDSPEQRWSMLFERLCQFDRIARQARLRRRADLSKLVSKAKSVAYSLEDLDRLTGCDGSASFRAEVEALRASFFDLAPEQAGAHTWRLFHRGLAMLDARLRAVLPAASGQRPVDFGRAFLVGRASIPGLSESALAERREAVARAQRASRALGFHKGDVFLRTPYPERIAALNRRQLPRTPVRALTEAGYWLRRTIREAAPGQS